MSEPVAGSAGRRRVIVLNTLGAALRHYGAELSSVLQSAGSSVELMTIDEPSASGGTARTWLIEYVRALRRARRSARSVGGDKAMLIVTWPVLGFADSAVIGLLFGRGAAVIVHDTKPLVRAVGYGRGWQELAALLQRQVTVLVHSQEALSDITSTRLRTTAPIVPHPILLPQQDSRRRGGDDRPTVRVLGQYKRDRDVDALREVARAIGSDHRLEIVGRRWPTVRGWAVRDAFVPEPELSDLIAGSAVVVIPYRRFYQSGIAIRCLEQGTSVVGPAQSSLGTLLGTGSRLLVDRDHDWAAAIRYAASAAGRRETAHRALAWRQHAVRRWGHLDLGPAPPDGPATGSGTDPFPEPADHHLPERTPAT